MNSNPELAPIFVRVYSRVRNEKARKEQWKSNDPKWANFALVLDSETTIDIRQDLTFLWWRFCELKDGNYVCQQEGVVYNDHLDKESVARIRSYARKPADVEDGCPEEIQVNSRTEFANRHFWEAIRAGAAIVCFNSPFDLSRLAVRSRPAKLKNTGWSVTPWPEEADPFKPKPWIRIKPKDSRSAFINLVGGDSSLRVVYAGRFLDLSVLGWALRNQHMDLNGFLKSFGLKSKAKHEPTGLVTEAELKYGQLDTERTVELLNAMKHEYDGFPLELHPEQAMSAASITKAFLEEMRITKSLELAGNVATGTNTNYSANPVIGAVTGNSINAFFFGNSTDAAGTMGVEAPNIVAQGMGAATTYGRRTTDIMSLNLAGIPGGPPQALTQASSEAKGVLGSIGEGLSFGLSFVERTAVDAAFTGAEVINCAAPPSTP